MGWAQPLETIPVSLPPLPIGNKSDDTNVDIRDLGPVPANRQMTDTAREAFLQEGWLLVPGLLSSDTVRTLVLATEALERDAAAFERDTLVRGVFFEMQTQSGKKGDQAVFPGALRKITSPSKGQAAFAKLRRDPRVRNILARCGLVEPQCLIDQVNFKLPRVGTCFPYHQDEAFVFGDALHRLRQSGGINLVIALDPADESNGGFEVLGRTHQNGIVPLTYDVSRMNHDVFDATHRALPALAPGDAILFHPRLAHGSQENHSDRPRRLVTLWYAGGEPSLVR